MNTMSSGGGGGVNAARKKLQRIDSEEELVSANAQQRNWRGILIALLVIVVVLALIVTSVIVLTPPDDGPRIRGTRFKLSEILTHEFQSMRFNGSWVSSNELMFRDHWGGISVMNVEDLSTKTILSNHTFNQYNPGRFILSPDKKYLLLVCNIQKLFRYSFLAQYYIFDIATTRRIIIADFKPRPGRRIQRCLLRQQLKGISGSEKHKLNGKPCEGVPNSRMKSFKKKEYYDRGWLVFAEGHANKQQLNLYKNYKPVPVGAKRCPLKREVFPLTLDESESQHTFFLHVDWAPRGNALYMVHDYDVYYKPSPTTDRTFRITNTAVPGIISNGIPDWLYEEEILSSNTAVWMSNDGHLLLYATFNDSLVGEIQLPWYNVNEDVKQYSEIRRLRYPKPGTTNPTVSLFVSDLADLDNINTRQIVPPQGLLRMREYYFSSASWISLTEICIVWINRPQNLSLVTVCKSPIWHCQETQRVSGEGKGWVEIFPAPFFTPDGKRYITLAPVRDGDAGYFRHIITVDIQKKRALPLTHGRHQVNKIIAWDHSRSLIYYLGTPEMYPSQSHLYSVSSEPPTLGSPLPTPTCITCSTNNNTADKDNNKSDLPFAQELDGKKKIQKKSVIGGEEEEAEKPCNYFSALFSPGLMFFVLECLGPNVPTVFLHSTKNFPELPSLITILQNNTKLKEKLSTKALPQIKTFGVDISGGYQAQVRLYLPPGLREDEVTRYPLVVQVYGGPGTQLVTDRWKIDWSTYLASNKDYIIAQIDGRGSAGQGYQLMHEVYHRLGTVEVADQLEVTEYLRDSLHFIDKRRVAVWGWSYGGFIAALLLAKGSGTFHCGISVAPVTNWALYDSAYTERYMGLPNVTDNYKGYEESDVSKWAESFRDKMLYLIHGTADDNVHFQQSMALVKALSNKGILFQQQVYPDEKHTLMGVKYHLYKSMDAYLENCFRRLVPPNLKSGLRNGGMLETTTT